MNKKDLIKAGFGVMVLVAFAMTAVSGYADDSKLRIESDLMIHPDQMGNFFAIGADKIKNSTAWSWPNLSFTKPYKTSWSGVMAVGPFDVHFDTSNLKSQQFDFELDWKDPRINIAQFEIHDILTRTVGGVPLRFHLDGVCKNMSLQIPGGMWKVHGRMRWDFVANQFVLSWSDFGMQINSAAQPTVDVGACEGPSDLFKELQTAMSTIARDQSWLGDVLKQGALDWLQSSLGGLQAQLLTVREMPLREDLKLTWLPSTLTVLPGGMIRVAGEVDLNKATLKGSASTGDAVVPRTYDPSQTLTQVRESGFVMPQNTLQKILGFMQDNHELQYRVKSTDVSGFVSLMQNPFMQIFIWPDLLSFASRTLFYFDLGAAAEPQLGTGVQLATGGSTYDFSAPLLVHQWAPTNRVYLPYVDFTSSLRGQMQATLNDGKLQLQTQLEPVTVKYGFRREYSLFRAVSTWLAASLLGSQVQTYVESKPFEVAVPDWEMQPGLTLGLRDLQAHPESFRIPLEFKTKH